MWVATTAHAVEHQERTGRLHLPGGIYPEVYTPADATAKLDALESVAALEDTSPDDSVKMSRPS